MLLAVHVYFVLRCVFPTLVRVVLSFLPRLASAVSQVSVLSDRLCGW